MEAQEKKKVDYNLERETENVWVEKLKKDIEDDKQKKVDKKLEEKKICQEIIKENEAQKLITLQQKQDEREKDTEMLRVIERQAEEMEEKRAAEWKAREDRIQNFMSKMADSVVKKQDKDNERANQIQRQYEEDKNNREDKDEVRKKQYKRKRNEEMRKVLEQQMYEKRQMKIHEDSSNIDHMKVWMDIVEEDNKKRMEEETKQK